jgi:hypothetical protein
MTNTTLDPRRVRNVSLWLVFAGVATAVLLALSQWCGVGTMRPLLAGLGAPCSFFGGAIAAAASFCGRDRRCAVIAASSLLPLAFWSWIIYESVYGRYAS